MPHVTCHISNVTCHMSHVTCHKSHVTTFGNIYMWDVENVTGKAQFGKNWNVKVNLLLSYLVNVESEGDL